MAKKLERVQVATPPRFEDTCTSSAALQGDEGRVAPIRATMRSASIIHCECVCVRQAAILIRLYL